MYGARIYMRFILWMVGYRKRSGVGAQENRGNLPRPFITISVTNAQEHCIIIIALRNKPSPASKAKQLLYTIPVALSKG